MKKQNILKLIVLLLLIITLAIIFSNSLEPVVESSKKSQDTMNRFAPVLGIVFGKGHVSEHLVRKLAHFSEFALLGAELMLFSVLNSRESAQGLSNCLFFGLSSAVTDESLQMLTDRDPQVIDVLLDFSGVLSGVLFILFAVLIIKLIKKEKL